MTRRARWGLRLARWGGWHPMGPVLAPPDGRIREWDERGIATGILEVLGPLVQLPPDSPIRERIETMLFVNRTTTDEAVDRAGRFDADRCLYQTGLRDAYGRLLGLYAEATETLRNQ